MHLNKCSVKILCRRAFTSLSWRFLGQHSWDVWIFYPSAILKTLFVNIHSNFWENASLITNIFCHFLSTSSKEKILIGWQNYIFFHVAMKWKKPAGWKREKEEHFWHNQKSFVCLLHEEKMYFDVITFSIKIMPKVLVRSGLVETQIQVWGRFGWYVNLCESRRCWFLSQI